MKRALICMSLIAAGSLTHAASFDCEKAATTIEKMICFDGQLSNLDSVLSQVYTNSLARSANSDAIKTEQREWLATIRNKCQDAVCLSQAYTDRITKLNGTSIPVAAPPAQSAPTASISASSKASGAATNPSPHADAVASLPPIPASPPAPSTQKVDATAKAPTPTTPSTTDSPSSPTRNPGFGLTDVFHVLFAIGMLALIVVMFRPSLAGRFIASPSRKKLFGIVLLYLIPVAALSHLTKTPERLAYEASVREEKEAERKAKQIEDGPPQQTAGENGTSTTSSAKREFARALQNGETLIRKVRSSASGNPVCQRSVANFYEFRDRKSANVIADFARVGDPETGFTNAAIELNMYIDVIRTQCGG